MAGANENTATRARAVASPVSCHTHIVSAKRVIPDPVIEISWPNQTTENANIPDGRRFGRCIEVHTIIHPPTVLDNMPEKSLRLVFSRGQADLRHPTNV
jgi:hypothetical protein